MMKIILYIGIAQTLFGAFVIFTKKEEQLSNTLLAIWMFLMGITLLSMLGDYYPETKLHRLQYIVLSPSFGPFLLLYTQALIKDKKHFKKFDLLHFIPTILLSFLALILIDETGFDKRKAVPFHLIIFGIPIVMSTLIYSIVVFRILHKHKKNIKNYFSYSSEKLTLNWLLHISGIFFNGFFISIIVSSYFISTEYLPFDPRIFIAISYSLIAYSFSYYGFIQPNMFPNKVNSNLKKQENEIPDKINKEDKNSSINKETRYEKSGLKREDAIIYERKLLNYMQEKEAYLKGDLTIQDVSDATQIPKHHITQVLNERLNKNFYTFVNEYRVKKVKLLLSNSKFNQFTILAIGYEAGFNSKSSYYNSFKKIEGFTPSEYRNLQER